MAASANMRPSRGMGIVSPSKMPKAKTITRKDDPNEVSMYAKGGKVKKFGDGNSVKEDFDRVNSIINRPRPKATPEKPKPYVRLPPSGEDIVGNKPLVTDSKGKEYIPEINRKAKGGKVNWIKNAIKKPGALRASLGAKKGAPIPAKKLAKAAKAPGKLGQRARFAEVLKGFKKK